MTDSEAISVRRAVRQYAMDSLPQRSLAQIGAQIARLRPLKPRIRISFEILTGEQLIEAYHCGVRAPYFMVISAEPTRDGRVSAGYMGEQLVLKLTGMGLGTCWLGSVRPKTNNPKDLPFLIAVAFGKPREEGLLETGYAHRRRELSSLLLKGDAPSGLLRKALEGARLAPSAINLQPCRYLVRGNAVALVRRASLIPILDRMRDIDGGIALAHVSAVARDGGMTVTETDLRPAVARLSGYRYLYGLVLREAHGA